MDFKILKGHVPGSVISELEEFGIKFGCNTNLRLCHFISQCAHESINFTALRENMNYSEKRLLEVFPKYFDETNVIYYARKPEKIANRVYASRMGNRNEKSGDGWRFRAAGFLGLTGAKNFLAFGKSVEQDFIKNPDKVATHYALTSALWFFQSNYLWKICDLRPTEDLTMDEIVEKLTRKINGGLNGIVDRKRLFKKFARILGVL